MNTPKEARSVRAHEPGATTQSRPLHDARELAASPMLNLISAKASLRSAVVLADAVAESPDRDLVTASIYLLLSRSMELALKAVLLVHGTSGPMSQDIGDDLSKSWRAVKETSFVAPAGSRPLAMALYEARTGNWLQYIPVAPEIIPLPDLVMTVATLDRLLEAVEAHLDQVAIETSVSGG